jgi:molybdate transport system regulatory protein
MPMKKDRKTDVRFRIWFYAGDEKLLGIGRVELLERIRDTGSITHAAKGMKMSYRQAWQMVTEMNERSGSPLVEKQLGGKTGGGAIVTEAGEKAIKEYHEFESRVDAFIKAEAKKLKL